MVTKSAIHHIAQKSLAGFHDLVLACGGSSYMLMILMMIGMRTISRCHAVFFLLPHRDAAVVTGVAAALAADVGRRVPMML